jgi:2,4-dienoyl-CoA reductase-like NADH-dependent reductase (Old Yellow Enzyme family)/thioredoxin reductase
MIDRLFEPLALGPVEIRNRVVSTAHQTTLVSAHLPTDDFVAYHQARARGGVGLIVLEAAAVHPSGLLTAHTLGGYLPAIVEGYRRVADAVQPHGTKLFVQLLHPGREQIADAPRPAAVAPSAIPSPRFRTEPRALRPEQVDELVDGYARAAAHAAAAGLDGVEVSAAHRYLLAQFLDPELNPGRVEEGRATARRILRAVRDAAPTLCLGVRVSADWPLAGTIVSLAEECGADYVSAALGDASSYLGSVGIVPPTPMPENAIEQAARSLPRAVPLIATSRVVDPVEAGRLVADGVCDAVGMTRALIADPELVAKTLAGTKVIRCIACNACIGHYHTGTPIACAVNPRTGRERTWPTLTRTTTPRRIVVVGGGPAGLAAAREAAVAGHRVTLLERADRLGGQAALSSLEVDTTLPAGLDVRLDTVADADVVGALQPDAVVVATGAKPYRPSLPLGDATVLSAWDVLAADPAGGRRVVVADWGGDPSGLEAAERLAHAGNRVMLAVASVAVGEGVHQYRRNLYLQRLYRAGVAIVHHADLAGATAGRVRLRNAFAPELEHLVPADLLVLAVGRVPEDALAPQLRAVGLRVEEAGDCLGPRGIEEAVLEGATAARRLAGLFA